MRTGYVLLLILSVVLAVSCSVPETQPPGTLESDTQDVEQVIKEWINAANANDPDKLLMLVCDDLEAIPPGQEPVTGAEAHQLYRGFFEPYNFAFDSVTKNIVVAGDWAFRRYSYDITLTPKAGGDVIKMQGHGIHMFRLQDDGSWCVVKDIWNSVPPSTDETKVEL